MVQQKIKIFIVIWVFLNFTWSPRWLEKIIAFLDVLNQSAQLKIKIFFIICFLISVAVTSSERC